MKDSIFQEFDRHERVIASFKAGQVKNVESCVKLLAESFKNGGKVLLCGNGGSASDCQHVAGELVGRFRMHRKALAAIALTTDQSIITSVSNDYSFDDIFLRQLEGLGQSGDVLWAFSTSGTSPNILKAAKYARDNEIKIIAFTGKKDSELEKYADVCICADCEYTSTSQEAHVLAYHIICKLVEEQMSK